MSRFYDAFDKPRAAPPDRPATVHVLRPDDRTSAYAKAALQRECEQLAATPEGNRDHAINEAAFNMGTLIGAGVLDESVAVAALWEAARATGQPEADIARALRSGADKGAATGGIENGKANPRQLPESTPAQVHAVTVLDANTGEVSTVTVPDDSLAQHLIAGGGFVLDVPDKTPAVWGEHDDILWAEGESLIIAAGNGAGKTTLAGQLVKGRLGLTDTVLGLPITPGRKRVLYLAMDRPAQIARSLRRHFTLSDRERLDEQLSIWKGPPPADLAKHPELLLSLVKAADADTVVVDSLKDAAIGLSDDEVGAGWNRARQTVIAYGCQVLELHHNIKRNPNGGEPSTIADVYGSAWITAGVGSAILLVGAPGDPVVRMKHVKQPSEEVGPWQLLHDHDRGVTGLYETASPLEIVQRFGSATAKRVAEVMFESDKVTAAEKMKAARRLDKLVSQGLLAATQGSNSVPREYRIAGPSDLYGGQS